MPVQIPFTWREDEQSLVFVLQSRGVKAKSVGVALCDVYVKVNVHPSLFEIDLLHEIDPEHPKTRCRVSPDKITLTLHKKDAGIWGEFRAEGTKADLRQRREAALASLEAREQERLKKRDDMKEDLLKQGERNQWKLDAQNRQTIEKWEKDEKEKWENEVYRSFDEEGILVDDTEMVDKKNLEDFYEPGEVPKQNDAEDTEEHLPGPPSGKPIALGPGKAQVQEVTDEEAAAIRAGKEKASYDTGAIWTQEELDDTEEYVPDVRANPGKIGIRFSERPRPGVPVRDRGQKAPPFPKNAPKADLPPMIQGDDQEDEHDPVWLKDKADQLMVNGDYQGAYNAYTKALTLASNSRCFSNRAVADLYLGNLEQCLEDCNHALRILDLRNKVRPGEMPQPEDPEDQKVRARCQIRMGVAYLWLGAFGKSEVHFEKALEADNGLDADETKQVKDDLERIQQARAAMATKEKADAAARQVGSNDTEAMETSLQLYGEAWATSQQENAVIAANRCQAHLRAGQIRECLQDADAALEALKRWPCASKAPKLPSRPARLDPPYLDDPTFVHPDKQKQGEVDWLMKHSGGSVKDLPGLPDEYEWVKDVAEQNDNAWIAVKRKMSKITIDAIKRATSQLQDTLYMRKPWVIRQQVEVAIDQNKAGEGPSAKAIGQAKDYASKLEEHEAEQEAERAKLEADKQQEVDEFDLEESLSSRRSGLGQTGFGLSHPVEKTRRRLFVKILLRRSRGNELLGHAEAAADDLRLTLKVEPSNAEAKQRLAVLVAVTEPTPSMPSNAPPCVGSESSDSQVAGPNPAPTPGGSTGVASTAQAGEASSRDEDMEEEENSVIDHASTAALLSSAAEYMKKADYPSALQIYNYARNVIKEWESPTVELKVLSNASLCLQRIRGRLPELISACNETLVVIRRLRNAGECKDDELLLLRMEAAALSRRGSAYAQQRKPEESAEDAARVKEILARVAELEGAAS